MNVPDVKFSDYRFGRTCNHADPCYAKYGRCKYASKCEHEYDCDCDLVAIESQMQ